MKDSILLKMASLTLSGETYRNIAEGTTRPRKYIIQSNGFTSPGDGELRKLFSIYEYH